MSGWKFQVEADFIRDHRLPAQARFLHTVLKSYVGRNSEAAWPSLSTLSRVCGWNRETVQKHLQVLEDHRHVVRDHARKSGRFQSVRYSLTVAEKSRYGDGATVAEKVRSGKKPQREKPTTEKAATNSNQFKQSSIHSSFPNDSTRHSPDEQSRTDGRDVVVEEDDRSGVDLIGTVNALARGMEP